jgi:hypothetical protein
MANGRFHGATAEVPEELSLAELALVVGGAGVSAVDLRRTQMAAGQVEDRRKKAQDRVADMMAAVQEAHENELKGASPAVRGGASSMGSEIADRDDAAVAKAPRDADDGPAVKQARDPSDSGQVAKAPRDADDGPAVKQARDPSDSGQVAKAPRAAAEVAGRAAARK